jgi:hypothetical protein
MFLEDYFSSPISPLHYRTNFNSSPSQPRQLLPRITVEEIANPKHQQMPVLDKFITEHFETPDKHLPLQFIVPIQELLCKPTSNHSVSAHSILG